MKKDTDNLRPKDNIHKILLSTTSRLAGEFQHDGMLLSHAWPQFSKPSLQVRFEESPVSRCSFVLVFETEPRERELVIPDFSPTGEVVCSYLSVLFGKRFDCHGLIEGSGFFNAPDLSSYNTLCDPRLPFNSHTVRKDYVVPLNLGSFESFVRALKILEGEPDQARKFRASCKFYMQAIQNAERDVEVAYIHLITSGEILASTFSYELEELADESILEDLRDIRAELNNGTKIVNRITSKLYWVKQRFVKSLASLVNDEFFYNQAFGSFTKNNIYQSIAAAYDMRSRYVHSGDSFGTWVHSRVHQNDLQFGRPVIENKKLQKIISKAPTLSGLERLIRFCILSYLSKYQKMDFDSYQK